MRALAAFLMTLALAAPAAYAQTGDAAKAACHDADGKPVKCVSKKRRTNGAGEGLSASALRCRDIRSHRFTKCGGPYAEPVPAE